ncbi:MAG: GFA family protein [Alphaproteobacteria bacterium]|nr:MAG: GFA family protein [Alphaproteobacteria bacterium]
MTALVAHRGGCHCGAVRFIFQAPAALTVERCNCSICRMTGFLHILVPGDRFHLLAGEDQLAEYRFGTRTARHLFCRVCGIKSFYVPRSHPDGYSIHLGCVDPATVRSVTITDFDGANWEREIDALRARHGEGA